MYRAFVADKRFKGWKEIVYGNLEDYGYPDGAQEIREGISALPSGKPRGIDSDGLCEILLAQSGYFPVLSQGIGEIFVSWVVHRK